jgi:hypothetical protein
MMSRVVQRLFLVVLLGAATGSVTGTAVAQTPGAAPTDNLSGAEMLESGEELVEEMESAEQRVAASLADELDDPDDAQQIEFIQERLAAITGFVQVGQNALGNLRIVVSGDRNEAVHNYNLIFVSAQRVRVLELQVQQSTGGLSRYTGDTVITPNIDERIPDIITWLFEYYWAFDDPLLGAVLSEASPEN